MQQFFCFLPNIKYIILMESYCIYKVSTKFRKWGAKEKKISGEILILQNSCYGISSKFWFCTQT